MTSLKHPVTGHEVNTDDESVDFWKSAGYVAGAQQEKKPAAKKAPAKKAAAKKSSK